MPKKIRNIVLIVLFVGLLAMVIVGGYDPSIKEETPPVTASQASLDRPVPVDAIIIYPSQFEHYISGTGVIEAWNRTQLASETGGRLVEWKAEVGQWLGVGEVLVQFDGTVAKLQADQAQAALETATIAYEKAAKDFQRQEKLKEQGDIGSSDFEAAQVAFKNARVGLKSAEAAAGLAKRAFDETMLKMPFSGRLSARHAVVGQSLAPGMPVAEIVQTEPLRIETGFPETEIVNIQIGQPVKITAPGWKDRFFTGTVHAVGSAAGTTDRLFPVIIRLGSNNNELKAGMAASLKILTNTYENAIVIPRESILPGKGFFYVYTVRDGRSVRSNVYIGAQSALSSVVTKGLSAGDTLITVGMASVRDGQKIDLTLQ